jgi:hypothetical protein
VNDSAQDVVGKKNGTVENLRRGETIQRIDCFLWLSLRARSLKMKQVMDAVNETEYYS